MSQSLESTDPDDFERIIIAGDERILATWGCPDHIEDPLEVEIYS